MSTAKKISRIYYLSAGDTPWQYRTSPGVDDVSHDPYLLDDEIDVVIERISRDIRAGYGSDIEEYWLRRGGDGQEALWVKTADTCEEEREEEGWDE